MLARFRVSRHLRVGRQEVTSAGYSVCRDQQLPDFWGGQNLCERNDENSITVPLEVLSRLVGLRLPTTALLQIFGHDDGCDCLCCILTRASIAM